MQNSVDTKTENEDRYLYKLIRLILSQKKFHICICDTSGIIRNNLFLNLPPENMMHYSEFCHAAKSTLNGLRLCLGCKRLSIKKASKSDIIFTGQCHMGISEIVKPVFINNRLSCIIYLGNFIYDNRIDSVIERIRKSSRITGVNEDMIIGKLDSVDVINEEDLMEYMNIVEVLYQSIVFSYTASYVQPVNNVNTSMAPTKAANHIIQSMIDYINVYYNLDLKLDQLAKLYFLNPNYLRNLFKKYTGMSFTDYLNKYRIEKAMDLLKKSNEQIINISMQVGFNNVTYFNKLFKRCTGFKPRQYRNSTERLV